MYFNLFVVTLLDKGTNIVNIPETINLTEQQLLAILNHSYCLINNYGGEQFFYYSKPTQEQQDKVFETQGGKGSNCWFLFERARLIQGGEYLQVVERTHNTPYLFTVLCKQDLRKFL